jgi:hypothetical protein
MIGSIFVARVGVVAEWRFSILEIDIWWAIGSHRSKPAKQAAIGSRSVHSLEQRPDALSKKGRRVVGEWPSPILDRQLAGDRLTPP